MARERSHAYPILDLATAYRIVRNDLAELGTAELHREVIAERLGYRTAMGGMAARKVGALVQYGLLNRRAARYGLSPLGMRLQRLDLGDAEFHSAIRSALERPVLFKCILEAFYKAGRIPSDLAGELAAFGISLAARKDAAGVFLESALFAGVIDTTGTFLSEPAQSRVSKHVVLSSNSVPPSEGEGHWHEFQLLLSGGRHGCLRLPSPVRQEDYNLLLKSFQNLCSLLPEHLGFERSPEGPLKESAEPVGRPHLVVGTRNREDRQS